MNSTQSASYTKTAKILHWLIALAIIFMLALGWSLDFIPKGAPKFFFFQLHKSIGITILLLSLARLWWRFRHKAPSLPGSLSLGEQRAAHLVHALLYTAMIGMPLSGWALVSTSSHNVPTILFGLVPWPTIPILPTLDNKKEISDLMAKVHGITAYILAVLVVGHIAAALKHHFISQDDILLRMAPQKFWPFFNRLRRRA